MEKLLTSETKANNRDPLGLLVSPAALIRLGSILLFFDGRTHVGLPLGLYPQPTRNTAR